MTGKELKRLGRADLLELLIQKTQRIEELEAQVKELESKLSAREIAVEKAGTLAEAALQLNGVFEAAQRAAEQYLENLKMRCEAGQQTEEQAVDSVENA